MSRVPKYLSLSGIRIDKTSSEPLYRQLYQELQTLILDGQLKPGSQLPPTRELSRELTLSRSTVLEAINQLIAEGYLFAEVGRGTFVSSDLGELSPQSAISPPNQSTPAHVIELSKRGNLYLSGRNQVREAPQPFIPGIPDVTHFPFKVWSRIYTRQLEKGSENFGYGDGYGYLPLREAIADYLMQSRRVKCTANQVVITAGTQQTLFLCAQLLTEPKDPVWIENPGYIGARDAFHAANCQIHPVPVDSDGIDIGYGIQHLPTAKLVYITPSHQYPAGGTLPLSRRVQLLEWAAQQNSIILEDDYDSEFRYSGHPLPSLQGLDEAGRVIYLGTFSKVMFPALRLAYIVVPAHLASRLASARYTIDRGSDMVTQMALSQFMREGHYARHIRRMRQLYRSRQQALVDAMIQAQTASEWLEIRPAPAGLHLVGWLPRGVNDQALSEHLQKVGLIIPPLSEYSVTELDRGGLVFGYAAQSEEKIKEAVQRLNAGWQTFMNMQSGENRYLKKF